MNERSALIVGSGIAGPAAAYWLSRHGFSPTIVERSSGPRTGGYVVDFWGKGYDVVEKMGLLPAIKRASVPVSEIRLVGKRGQRCGGFNATVFEAVSGGRYVSLPRSDLSNILYQAIAASVRVRWGDEPVSFEQVARGVRVEFRHNKAELFNVVIGADGLHSTVRQHIFGELERFEHFLGFMVGAFEVTGYPQRDEGVYVSFGSPGRQVARLALPNDRTMFLVVVAGQPAPERVHDRSAAKLYLQSQLSGAEWELPEIRRALDGCEDVYFDRVSQIRMPRWSRGAVALVGDAAYAPSLLAGQGSALAVVGAYVLAGELSHAVVPEGAFQRYEDLLRPFIREKQDSAAKFAGSFAPSSRFGVWLRNVVTRTFSIPGVAKTLVGRSLRDAIELPTYAEATPTRSAAVMGAASVT